MGGGIYLLVIEAMSDPVNHPSHYTCYEHEVIELSLQLSFCMGNVVKAGSTNSAVFAEGRLG